MRRFRFEVVSPEHFPDPEGALLRNLDEAKREAWRLGAALVRDYPEAFAKPGPWQMVILDDAGHVLAEIDLEPQARSPLCFASTQAPSLHPGQRLSPWTFSGGQLYLRQRSGKKDR